MGSSVNRPSGVVSPKPTPSRAAQMLAQAVVAHDPAAHAVAEHDHVPAHRPAEDQVVERGDAVESAGDISSSSAMSRNALVGDPAAVPLHDLHRIDADAPAWSG